MKPWNVARALGLTLISAGDATAQTRGKTVWCIIEHRFDPGPIVNGRHQRQPTLGEVEARTQQLRAFGKVSASFCSAAPRDSGTRMLPSEKSPYRAVELDPRSSTEPDPIRAEQRHRQSYPRIGSAAANVS
jgi:hypothetical protein